MEKYFSPSDLGFYIEGINKNIPDDAVIVSDDVYSEFAGVAWPDGKVLGCHEDGQPCWVDAPPLSKEEEIEKADIKKQSLIEQTNSYINSRQWPGKAALGRLSDSEKTQYNACLDYLDALYAIDTSTAPDIDWPAEPTE